MDGISKRWRIFPPAGELCTALARAMNLSPLVAQVLINRGLTTVQAVSRFFTAGIDDLHDPFQLAGMSQAVARIKQAVLAGENITVYGDYDADGITSTALVLLFLRRLGAKADYYIPVRQSEGYGVNEEALWQLKRQGTNLVITVDCGISAAAEVATAAQLGLDVIITDHHQPPPVLPSAVAVINPRQPGCLYPEKNLAGVGVAFKLCQACADTFAIKERADWLREALALVCIGTIADVVPLTGENRVLVKLGLGTLAHTDNVGLQALLQVCGLKDNVNSTSVAYVIAPRLNAAGRMNTAAKGVELLLATEQEKALALASALNRENAVRQAVEKTILETALSRLEDSRTRQDKVLVLAEEGWHPGVIGIVASRLVERFYRPVILISLKDGIGYGSCRSIPGFDIYQALATCSDLLERFGGHVQAAGLTVRADNIGSLRERLNAYARQVLKEEDFIPSLSIDAEISLSEIDDALVLQLTRLEPYGTGNPAPVFACRGVTLTSLRNVGPEGKHLRLQLQDESAGIDGIGWGMGAAARLLPPPCQVDVAFHPVFDTWQGRQQVQLEVLDVHPVGAMPPRRENAAAAKTEFLTLPGYFVHDRRYCPDRLSYLCASLAGVTKAVVIVNTPEQALHVKEYFSRCRGDGDDVLLWHEGMSSAAGEKVVHTWSGNLRRLLVATAAVAATGKLAAGEHYFWYFLPLEDRLFFRFLDTGQTRTALAHLHILFNSGDMVLNRAFWADRAPDRQTLARIYLVLKRCRNVHNEIKLTKKEICEQVAKLFGTSVSLVATQTALVILSEMGLVREKTASEGGGFVLLPSAGKISLATSRLFRTRQQARQRFEQFAAACLNLPMAELLNQWRKSSGNGEVITHGF